VSANPKSFDPGGSGLVDGLRSLDELKDLGKRRKVVGGQSQHKEFFLTGMCARRRLSQSARVAVIRHQSMEKRYGPSIGVNRNFVESRDVCQKDAEMVVV
jgi:hypothetical protein